MKFRLARLLRLRKQQTKQAEQQLSNLNNERVRRQQIIQQLYARIGALDAPATGDSQLPSTSLWSAGSRYLEVMLKQIQQQQALLVDLDAKYAAMREEFLRRHVRWRSLERLQENHQREQQQKLQKQYQRNMDDFVLARRRPTNTAE